MKNTEIEDLFCTMANARFDEFTIRMASFGLRFSKNFGDDEIVFNLETQCDIKDIYNPFEKYEPTIGDISQHLYNCLEMTICSIKMIDNKVYEICFDRGEKIYIVNEFNDKYSEIFSVITKNWPKDVGFGYFYI